MKKRLFWAFGVLCVVALSLASCQKEEEFDETLLIGKWQRPSSLTDGLDCIRFDASYSDYTCLNGVVVKMNGTTWDTGDYETEADVHPFLWTLDKSTLTLRHFLKSSGVKEPKTYTVTKLTSKTLSYEDDYGKSYTFTKVN